MKQCYNYIFNDLSENLWKFTLNKSKTLVYNILYSDEKWTKDIRLDVNVLEFTAFKDVNENIHILYKKINSIKYCLWNGSQWLGKSIHEFDDGSDINELKLIVINNCVHAFFILNTINSINPSSYIMHYRSDEDSSTINHICTTSINPNSNNHYSIETINNKDICLIYTNYTNSYTDIKKYLYTNDSWVDKGKIWSDRSEIINICTTEFSDEIHILMLSTSNSLSYLLSDLYISSNEIVNYYVLSKDDATLDNIHFITICGTVCSIWTTKTKINYCFFNHHWSFPLKLSEYNPIDIHLYNCSSLISNDNLLHCSNILVKDYPKLKFIYPNEPLPKENISFIKPQTPSNLINQHEIELISLKKSLDEANQSIDYFKIKLEEERTSYAQLEKSLSSSLNENEVLKKELEKYKDEYEYALSDCSKDLEQSQSQNIELTENLKKSTVEINELKINIESLRQQYLEAQDKLKSSMTECKNIQDSLTFSQNQYDNLLTNLKLTQNNYANLQDTIKLTNSQCVEIRTKLNITESLYNELSDKFKYNQNEYSDVKHSLHETQQQLLTVIREKEQLLMSLNKVTNEKETLTNQLEKESKRSIINKLFK